MRIAGLDIGTTGCKLTVFDESGQALGRAYREYPARRAGSGHEIDISALMDGVWAVLREMASRFADIAAVGVTSFGETFVMTDAAGEPLHDSMLYTDPRGADECRALCERLGAERIASITGLRPHEMYSIGKIMYLKTHRPDVFGAAKRIFLIGDYVVWRLSGRAVIDYSLASRTMAFDIHRLAWSEEVLAATGIDPGMLSECVPTGTCAGSVTPIAAERTGLSTDCRIVMVSHDQVAAAVGAGAFDGSVAVDGAGTTQCLTPIYDTLPDISVMSRGGFSVVPYPIPGKYVAYAFSYTGGALLQWFAATLARKEREEAREQGKSVYTLLEERFGAEGPTGLLVMPHFAGAGTPYMDMGSRGAILGLTAGTDLGAIYRACMEGVGYEMRLNCEALAGSGVRFTRLHATGGGARSRVWMQMKADILGLPITALETADAGTVGSAMLTGVAISLFPSLEAAASIMVRKTETFTPDMSMHEKYTEVYRRYRKVYEAVRPLM